MRFPLYLGHCVKSQKNEKTFAKECCVSPSYLVNVKLRTRPERTKLAESFMILFGSLRPERSST
jgi:hypothetical protein